MGEFSNCFRLSFVSRDSAVGTATGYRLEDGRVGVRVPVGSRICTSPCRPDRLWGALKLLPEVNRMGREADHSPPTGAEVKKMCIYTSTPPYALMV
jgi:hypothetical protein